MMLRLQDATITAQQCTIDAQKALIHAERANTSDSEPLIEGILDIVPVESGGVRVNLPALWRHIRDLFVVKL